MNDDQTECEPSADGHEPAHDFGFRRAAAKVREFPQTAGVYLMKDSAGRVIYVGKAKNLRSRATDIQSRRWLRGACFWSDAAWATELGRQRCFDCLGPKT